MAKAAPTPPQEISTPSPRKPTVGQRSPGGSGDSGLRSAIASEGGVNSSPPKFTDRSMNRSVKASPQKPVNAKTGM